MALSKILTAFHFSVFRFCIVAAGIVKRNRDRLVADFVPNSLVMWQSQLKPKKGEDDDYHVNFTSLIFENWFSKLCKRLLDTYGSCVIHMDGASYHKQIMNPVPTSTNIKADIQKWLQDQGTNLHFYCLLSVISVGTEINLDSNIPEIGFAVGLIKAQLLQIVKQ